MNCIACKKIVNEDHTRTLAKHNIPDEFCSSCYIEMVLAEGNCNKCNTLVRHRVKANETVTLQRMAMTRGKFMPRIRCSCGGIISLTRIGNKDFLKRLWESITLKNRMLEKLQYG